MGDGVAVFVAGLKIFRSRAADGAIAVLVRGDDFTTESATIVFDFFGHELFLLH